MINSILTIHNILHSILRSILVVPGDQMIWFAPLTLNIKKIFNPIYYHYFHGGITSHKQPRENRF